MLKIYDKLNLSCKIYDTIVYYMKSFILNIVFSISKYRDPVIISIFLLSISSAIPFLLLLSTLNVCLTEIGMKKSHIGLLSWITFPYAIKFILAPFFDKFSLPILSRGFGRMNSWMILIQILLMISIFIFAHILLANNFHLIMIFGFIVGLLSACQDILIEGFRIVNLDKKDQGIGVSAAVIGYRVGMLISGAGGVFLSDYLPWNVVYVCLSMCILIGLFTAIVSSRGCDETINITTKESLSDTYKSLVSIIDWKSGYIIFMFILFFKTGDTIMHSMSIPFLLEIGFSKVDISTIVNSFGILAMAVGVIVGGFLILQYSLQWNLVLCLVLQFLSCLLFALQAYCGCFKSLLWFTMGFENLVTGISQTMLITYLTSLCSSKYPMSQFALLASFSSLCRVILTNISGMWAEVISWEMFYLSFSLVCLLAIYLIKFHSKGLRLEQCNSNIQ